MHRSMPGVEGWAQVELTDVYKVTQDLSLIFICKQETFSPVLSINSSQKDKAFNYLLNLPNRTSSQFFVYFGNSLLD